MILELLASEWKKQIEELYVNERLFDEIIASFPSQGREFKRELCTADAETISKISTLENNIDGVAVVRQTPPNLPLPRGGVASSLLAKEGIERGAWILLLDGIRDPGNMGTILRTASWFGVERIICSGDSVELYKPKVVSATMGAIFHLQISYMNLQDFYKKNILPVYVAELGGTNVTEITFPKS
jgi:RNA methyltransferase, TrmH family